MQCQPAADRCQHPERHSSWVAVPDQLCAAEDKPDQALVLVSMERVAGLSVLDSDALLPGPGGCLERILTGFQVPF